MRANLSLIVKLGAGFFADAYDLFVMDIVLAILKQLAKEDPSGIGLTGDDIAGWVSAATSIGAIIGMIVFGIIGDSFGRLSAILTTGSIVGVGSLSAAFCFRNDSFTLISQLIVIRFLLGIGIGGEYPLSAVMASESANKAVRGRIIAGVFSMQGVGMFFSAFIAYTMNLAGSPLEVTWRVLLAFGCLPAILAVYLRFRMTETSAYSANAMKASRKSRMERIADMWDVIKQNKKALIGTTSTWFLLDVTFYGTGQFKHSIYESLYSTKGLSQHETIGNITLFALIISLVAIPGYLCSCAFIDAIGRYRLQVWGFAAMITCYLIMAFFQRYDIPAQLHLVVFGLTFFFTNFGPNTTTFIIPSEIFPSSVSTTCHGISAAVGKAGAVLGVYALPYMLSRVGLYGVMLICAGVALMGLLCTLLFVPQDEIVHRSEPDMREAGVARHLDSYHK